MGIRILRSALIGAGTVLLAACSSAVAVTQAVDSAAVSVVRVEDTTDWRIVQTVQYCGSDNLLSVTAAGPHDAWAVGLPDCGVDVRHWDGTSWYRVPVPRRTVVTVPPFFPYAPVAASSARDAWIFPRAGTLLAPNHGYALHWNGATWHKLALPDNLVVAAAAAFSLRDAWVFGGVQHRPDVNALHAPYAARYDGHTWHVVTMPGQPLAVSALSPSDIWAVGPTLKTAGEPRARQAIIAMHWTGRSWHAIPVPKITAAPIGQSFLSRAFAAAAGPHDLWWAYPVSASSHSAQVVVLHWDGSRWHRIALPGAIASIDGMTQDGHGGLWLIADFYGNNPQQYWYHYNGGRWTRQLVPSPRGYSNVLSGMAWVPGTGTVWAVGEADHSGGSIGVIARYSP